MRLVTLKCNMLNAIYIIEDIARWRKDKYYFRAVEILFSTRENNIRIFKLPYNVLFIIWSEVGTMAQRTYKSRRKIHPFSRATYFFISSLVKTWKIRVF